MSGGATQLTNDGAFLGQNSLAQKHRMGGVCYQGCLSGEPGSYLIYVGIGEKSRLCILQKQIIGHWKILETLSVHSSSMPAAPPSGSLWRSAGSPRACPGSGTESLRVRFPVMPVAASSAGGEALPPMGPGGGRTPTSRSSRRNYSRLSILNLLKVIKGKLFTNLIATRIISSYNRIYFKRGFKYRPKNLMIKTINFPLFKKLRILLTVYRPDILGTLNFRTVILKLKYQELGRVRYYTTIDEEFFGRLLVRVFIRYKFRAILYITGR
ncbi:hypothetical protein QBC40DRAFT_291837 [Triangularia verruculosa]|uniref:Uncharacterized protein n=1 Tax=Triangularia verruculosa TaxID=2587418 RepID=A0AAN6XTT4_9PEZI|nr:hypothetical protein QBC40DRAFT_291837 [Triangularia verruculosa]